MKKSTIQILFVVIIICISFSAIFVKLSDAPSSVMVMYRMFFACTFLSPICFKYRKSLQQMTRKEWFAIVTAGIFLAAHFGLWFESLNHTTVASSTLILAMQPAVALIGGLIFFKEKVNMRLFAAMFIAMIGIVIVSGGNVELGRDGLYGNFLSFLSVISVVCCLLIGQRNVRSISHWIYSFLVFFIAGLSMLIFNVINQLPLAAYSAHDWLIFVLLAVFPSAAHIIFNMLLKYVNTTTVSMSVLGEPVGASILAFFILDERIALAEIVGGIFIIAGIFYFLRVQNDANANADTVKEN